ncbi:S1 family peptidase [Aquabacterium sp.]|uniref:S1 family peptidase n=1 Tax=Aquabacterium sp. TaxID=1872578 RepID=UPI002CB4A947|nr:serine protease [Aquabacterium sp.]HSW08539.1 serine protease [Aquabacterium sp.]
MDATPPPPALPRAAAAAAATPAIRPTPVIEPLLLAAARVSTFDGERLLTHASGFFFEREGRLFLVTSRHVVIDTPSKHFPDRLQIELHTDAQNLAQSTGFSIPLYRDGRSIWRQGTDDAGEIDVALVELERQALPATLVYRAFTPAHLVDLADRSDPVQVGSSLLIVGFPLGFHDTLHHLPVVRQAISASSYGLRFQGEGYFLTDARTHRGTSGAPVVMRVSDVSSIPGDLPWRLLGVHSARLDVGSRDEREDEALGLNCAWYADILMTLSAPATPASPVASERPRSTRRQSADARTRTAAAPADPAKPSPR